MHFIFLIFYLCAYYAVYKYSLIQVPTLEFSDACTLAYVHYMIYRQKSERKTSLLALLRSALCVWHNTRFSFCSPVCVVFLFYVISFFFLLSYRYLLWVVSLYVSEVDVDKGDRSFTIYEHCVIKEITRSFSHTINKCMKVLYFFFGVCYPYICLYSCILWVA